MPRRKNPPAALLELRAEKWTRDAKYPQPMMALVEAQTIAQTEGELENGGEIRVVRKRTSDAGFDAVLFIVRKVDGEVLTIPTGEE